MEGNKLPEEVRVERECFIYLVGRSGVESTNTEATYWPTVPALDDDDDDDDDDCGAISGMNEWQGKPKYLETTRPSAAVHHRYPCVGPRSNPGRGVAVERACGRRTAKATLWLHATR
jgi:hypothetical protein